MAGLSALLYPYVKERDVNAIEGVLNVYRSFDEGVVNAIVTDAYGYVLFQVGDKDSNSGYSSHTMKLVADNEYVGSVHMDIDPDYYTKMGVDHLYGIEYMFGGLFGVLILFSTLLHLYFIK